MILSSPLPGTERRDMDLYNLVEDISALFGFAIIATIAARKQHGWYPVSTHAWTSPVASCNIFGHARRRSELGIPLFLGVVFPAANFAQVISSVVSTEKGSDLLGIGGVVSGMSRASDWFRRRLFAKTFAFSSGYWAGGLPGESRSKIGEVQNHPFVLCNFAVSNMSFALLASLSFFW